MLSNILEDKGDKYMPEVKSNIRFHINSNVISGSLTLTFESYLIVEMEEEIDDFIISHKNKEKKDSILIQKVKNAYEINVNAIMTICQIIFRVLKKYS